MYNKHTHTVFRGVNCIWPVHKQQPLAYLITKFKFVNRYYGLHGCVIGSNDWSSDMAAAELSCCGHIEPFSP